MAEYKTSVKENYDKTAKNESLYKDSEAMFIIRKITNSFKGDVLNYVFRDSRIPKRRVLNLGAGRGGDLQALSRCSRIDQMIAVDISGSCLEELQTRNACMKRKFINELWCLEADFTHTSFFSTLQEKFPTKYTNILLNLCIHYIPPSSLCSFIDNICSILEKKASICIIYYESEALRKICDKKILSYKNMSFGQFSKLSEESYNVSLGSSLEGVPEYFVTEEPILLMAAKHGFKVVMSTSPILSEKTDAHKYVSCLRSLVLERT